MFIDAQTQLAAAQALSATALLTNAYDLGAVPSNGSANGDAVDPSNGEPLCVAVAVTVAADHTTGDETYEFDVITSANSNLSSARIVAKYPIAAADVAALLPLGGVVILPIPPRSVSQRYLGVNAVLGGTTPSVTVTAWITTMSMIQAANRYYTTLITIS